MSELPNDAGETPPRSAGPALVRKVGDPVCGMSVDAEAPKGGVHDHEGQRYYFCSAGCREKFRADPTRYLAPTAEDDAPEPAAPVTAAVAPPDVKAAGA